VVGVDRSIVVVTVASHALGWCAGELFVLVAITAVGNLMFPVESKHPIVVEGSRSPARCRLAMTTLAIGSKSGSLVIRVSRPIVVLSVTGHALGRCTGELAVAVAITAVRYLMFSPQRETLIVIEGCTGPAGGRRAMAALTVGWKPSLLMIGVASPLVVGLVAAHTI
jgi:hypothetical protein